MPPIHEIATLTSKGQVTLPKSVRQLLGLDTGGKIAFDVRGGEVEVSRVEAKGLIDPHTDAASNAPSVAQQAPSRERLAEQ